MISPGFLSCEHTLNTLRYANRVKELGTDNAELKSTDEDDEDMMVNGDSDDLELLKGGNVSFAFNVLDLILMNEIFTVQRRSLLDAPSTSYSAFDWTRRRGCWHA